MDSLHFYFGNSALSLHDLNSSTPKIALPFSKDEVDKYQAAMEQIGPINEELFQGIRQLGDINEANAARFDHIISLSNDFKSRSRLLFEFLQEKQSELNLFELAFNRNKPKLDSVPATPLKGQSMSKIGSALIKKTAEYGEKSGLQFVFDERFREASLSAKKSFRMGKREAVSLEDGLDLASGRLSFVASKEQLRVLALKPHVNVLRLQMSQVFKKFPVVERKDRRDGLPAFRDPKATFNLWSIFKDNMGKDLSKITMPVYTKEPITMLQKFCEFAEYLPLLAKAAKTEDSRLRICYVAGLQFILYANTINRLRQPFNSLLGETFEWVEGGARVIVEQVSNHPPVLAFYAESADFVAQGEFLLKSNLSITSFEFQPMGRFDVHLKHFRENYSFQRPNNSLHNYIMGTMYLWVKGSLSVRNETTGDFLEITFKPKGWSSKHDYEVTGKVTALDGTVHYTLAGKWDSFLTATAVDSRSQTEIVRKSPPPPDADQQYFFSGFTLNLNYLNVFLLPQLAPTDSRLRPDLRAYEYGDFELAALEKNRLEENQRSRRKMAKEKGGELKPVWFDFEMREKTPFCRYKGGYFEARDQNRWPEVLPDLYND